MDGAIPFPFLAHADQGAAVRREHAANGPESILAFGTGKFADFLSGGHVPDPDEYGQTVRGPAPLLIPGFHHGQALAVRREAEIAEVAQFVLELEDHLVRRQFADHETVRRPIAGENVPLLTGVRQESAIRREAPERRSMADIQVHFQSAEHLAGARVDAVQHLSDGSSVAVGEDEERLAVGGVANGDRLSIHPPAEEPSRATAPSGSGSPGSGRCGPACRLGQVCLHPVPAAHSGRRWPARGRWQWQQHCGVRGVGTWVIPSWLMKCHQKPYC